MAGDERAAGAVRGMMNALAHRGPDGEGLFVDGDVALGHRRLAVLDPTGRGRQPMTSRDGRWTIVLNGEIFNYQDLRETSTDTEALLETCAARGVEAAIEQSNGMFGVAFWDARERELTLARDRSGEKPLVYCVRGRTLAFASELKALAAFHERRLDPAAVDAYLALGYVPAPLTIFRDCRKLPPGHFLKWRDGAVSVRRWWFPENASVDARGTLPQVLGDAVRLRLRADVPVAIALSGGIDSSVVAAECARQGVRPPAFTVVCDGDDTDLPYARLVAAKLELRHEVIRIGGAGRMEDAARHYDEPFADSSALPSLALARALGGRYKVVLNGDGGDEAFGGYQRYEFAAMKDFIRGCLRRSVVPRELADRDPYLQRSPRGALKRALWRDRHLYLPNDLMYKMDIALSSAGVEGRAPFLDHRVLQWAQALPASKLVRGRQKKIALREAYRGALPDAVLDRPKQGFGAPVKLWLREVAGDLLPCPLLERGLQRNLSGTRLWSLATFALWARQWSATW